MQNKILYLTNENGDLCAVQISIELWEKIKPLISEIISSNKPEISQNDLEAFEEFLKYWDFSYPYSPKITCPNCHTSTQDWRIDTTKPFILTNANFGGLLVFHCQACGAVIKQMHFKDHVATEVQG